MQEEIWKDIVPGLYQVSNMGRIKSLKYHKEKILKAAHSTSNGGKRQDATVTLYVDGNRKTYVISRLVWQAFNGTISEGMQINHINENPLDNRLENLNLMSAKENSNWGTRTERIKQQTTNGKCSLPVLQFDTDGNLLKEWPSVMEIERQLGYSNGYISSCCGGKDCTPYGFKWVYK